MVSEAKHIYVAVKSMYKVVMARIWVDDDHTEEFLCSWGLKQRDSCGPILFSLLINKVAPIFFLKGKHDITLSPDILQIWLCSLSLSLSHCVLVSIFLHGPVHTYRSMDIHIGPCFSHSSCQHFAAQYPGQQSPPNTRPALALPPRQRHHPGEGIGGVQDSGWRGGPGEAGAPARDREAALPSGAGGSGAHGWGAAIAQEEEAKRAKPAVGAAEEKQSVDGTFLTGQAGATQVAACEEAEGAARGPVGRADAGGTGPGGCVGGQGAGVRQKVCDAAEERTAGRAVVFLLCAHSTVCVMLKLCMCVNVCVCECMCVCVMLRLCVCVWMYVCLCEYVRERERGRKEH